MSVRDKSINAIKTGTEKVKGWREKINSGKDWGPSYRRPWFLKDHRDKERMFSDYLRCVSKRWDKGVAAATGYGLDFTVTGAEVPGREGTVSSPYGSLVTNR
jgi:hypothetical protein